MMNNDLFDPGKGPPIVPEEGRNLSTREGTGDSYLYTIQITKGMFLCSLPHVSPRSLDPLDPVISSER